MLAGGPKIDIDRQTGVERVAGFGDEAFGELALEHEDRHAGGVGHGEHLEDQRRGDLVGCVGDEGVAGGHFGHFDHVTEDDFELFGQGGALDALGYFGAHAGVDID